MKHVFTDISTIAHLWANQLQEDARNGGWGNFYFKGDTIYLYGSHFPIAKHVEFNGKKAVLFTTRSYSNTTSSHISVVRQSCRHKNVIYCQNPDNSKEQNINDYIYRIEEVAKNLPRARKPEIYLQKINEIINEAKLYLEFFELEIPSILQEAFNIIDKEKYDEYLSKKHANIKADRIKREKAEKIKHKEALKKWLTGETHRMYAYSEHDYLRLIDGKNIETSQAVKLSVELGRELYKRIKENTLVVGNHVLNFNVLEAGKEYKIGCHTFPRKYLLDWGTKNLVL